MTTLAEPISAPETPGNQPARRLRVLVNAYAVSPARGSEPGVGWRMTQALAKYHDLTVLCAEGTPGPEYDIFKREIEAHLAKNGPVPGLTIHYVPRPAVSRWFQSERELYRRTVYYTGYKSWQKSALREARRLHAEKPFDIIHQLNMTGFREPGYLWKIPNVPFVWGPIGGASNIPFSYFSMMGWVDRLFYTFRNVSNELQKIAALRCRRAAARASHIWAIGHQMRDLVEQGWGKSADLMLETGTIERADARIRQRQLGRPLRVVWSALHIGRKGLPILLKAMAKVGPAVPMEAVILGGGPLTQAWKDEAAALGVAGRVNFPGKLTQAEALKHVNDADVMAFTSVQEGTPHAVLEAMSLGVPVICHDACGMGVAVDDTCGMKVPMIDVPTSVNGFAEALQKVAESPDLLGRLSAGALERSAELNWAGHARRINAVYQQYAGSVRP